MGSFLDKFRQVVRGVVSGLDRVFFRGALQTISYRDGLECYLRSKRILYKDLAAHCLGLTERLKEASLRQAKELGREIRYLNAGTHCKEDIAREIAARDHIKQGLICVLSSIDPCMSVQVSGNHRTKRLEANFRPRKCLHFYHYQIHPIFGFMHARIQTWFPFTMYVCINGREWLARQMDQVGLHYRQRDNTFTWLEDLAQTQALFDQQLQANWFQLLGDQARMLNPVHEDMFAQYPSAQRHHWSVIDSEWATDVMFSSRAALQTIYPRLLSYAVNTFGSAEVLRFLGQRVPASGKVPHCCRHEVVTNLTERVEGVRLKHWLNGNSLKIYDKLSNLRVETTIREPKNFRVYRPAEGDPEGPETLRPLRLGVADLQRRAQVCQAANERYLDALAAVHDTTPLYQQTDALCQPASASVRSCTSETGHHEDTTLTPTVEAAPPVLQPPKPRARRVRALNPLAPKDARLLEAVSRHEFLIDGLRNRDVRRLLYGEDPEDPAEQRKRSAMVTRQLRLLRAHKLIDKKAKTHCYLVTERGRQVITAVLAARNANTEQLTAAAG
jgi:hypothetical protein